MCFSNSVRFRIRECSRWVWWVQARSMRALVSFLILISSRDRVRMRPTYKPEITHWEPRSAQEKAVGSREVLRFSSKMTCLTVSSSASLTECFGLQTFRQETIHISSVLLVHTCRQVEYATENLRFYLPCTKTKTASKIKAPFRRKDSTAMRITLWRKDRIHKPI